MASVKGGLGWSTGHTHTPLSKASLCCREASFSHCFLSPFALEELTSSVCWRAIPVWKKEAVGPGEKNFKQFLLFRMSSKIFLN